MARLREVCTLADWSLGLVVLEVCHLFPVAALTDRSSPINYFSTQLFSSVGSGFLAALATCSWAIVLVNKGVYIEQHFLIDS